MNVCFGSTRGLGEHAYVAVVEALRSLEYPDGVHHMFIDEDKCFQEAFGNESHWEGSTEEKTWTCVGGGVSSFLELCLAVEEIASRGSGRIYMVDAPVQSCQFETPLGEGTFNAIETLSSIAEDGSWDLCCMTLELNDRFTELMEELKKKHPKWLSCSFYSEARRHHKESGMFKTFIYDPVCGQEDRDLWTRAMEVIERVGIDEFRRVIVEHAVITTV